MSAVEILAQQLSLGDFLAGVRALGGESAGVPGEPGRHNCGSAARTTPADFEILWHHTQGEFHHDLAVRVPEGRSLPRVLVVATNCNGGVKEVLAFDEAPTPEALWHHRCPDNPEFVSSVALPPIRDRATTIHFFDPCELLKQDARSELREEHRARQPGGGWCMAPDRK